MGGPLLFQQEPVGVEVSADACEEEKRMCQMMERSVFLPFSFYLSVSTLSASINQTHLITAA